MFDVSLSELFLTGLVGFLVLGKKDFKDLLSTILDAKSYFGDLVARFKAFINDQLNEEDIVDIIYDEEGKPHKAYNIENLKPFLRDKEDDR